MPRIVGWAAGASINVQQGTLVAVPDVVGNTQAVATSTLEAALFVVTVVQVFSEVDIGDVVSQYPLAAEMALEGSTVTINVSKGPFVGGTDNDPLFGTPSLFGTGNLFGTPELMSGG